jgi:hypothetical protein
MTGAFVPNPPRGSVGKKPIGKSAQGKNPVGKSPVGKQLGERPKFRKPLPRKPLIAAATVAMVALVAFLVLREKAVPNGVVLLRSPKPEAVLSAPAFVWRPSPGVASYELEIVTETGEPVFSTASNDTTVAVPAQNFAAGKKYLWLVRGLVHGDAKAVSHIDRFTYQP